MAKRRAAEQIAKGFAREDDSSSEEEQTDGAPAAPEVLAGRKIAVPRSRIRKPVGTSSESATSGGNPFSQLTRPESEPQAQNPFGFLNKPAESSTQPQSPSALKPVTGTAHTSEQLKLRALNSNFAAQVAKASTASPFEDWTQMCEKYIGYAKKITEDGPTKTGISASAGVSTGLFGLKPGAVGTQVSASETKAGSETESSGQAQLTSSGFSFGPQATSSKTFQFGGKTIDNTKTHTSKPSGGFVFNPNGAGEIKASPAEDNDVSDMKDADTSSQSNKSEHSGKTENPKPTFTFGMASSGPVKSEAKESSKPFSFGAPQSAPKFSFGKTEDKAKPEFNFTAPKAVEKENPTEAKSASSFGTTPAQDDKKPGFTFGNPTAGAEEKKQESKPIFAFGPPSSGKLDFSFGANSKTEENKDKPAFSFGTPKQADAKPAFSFQAPSSTGSSGQSPAFSFGANDSKPAFSFGSKGASEKPKFQFGSANKSEFSFGTGVNPFGAKSNDDAEPTKVDAAWKPDHPIKIATVDDVASGSAVNGTSGNGTTTEGEPSEEQNDPQTDLGGPGPGEENEDCVYEKKSKAFELVAGEYKPLGLGFLRVLVHKESKKARALIRAEGSGRVLLNIPIRKEFNYTVVGKGQVKLLDVKPGEDSPTVYLARVKTEEDGNELKDKLQEVKN